MSYIEIPEIKELRGEEAVNVLNTYIHELETQGDKNLTPKQTKALVKFAKALVSTIETERIKSAQRDTKKPSFVTQLKKIIMNREHDSGSGGEKDKVHALPTYSPLVYSSNAISKHNVPNETTVPK